MRIWGELVTCLEIARTYWNVPQQETEFTGSGTIEMLKCALIAPVEESALEERNERDQLLDTPFHPNKYLWLAG